MKRMTILCCLAAAAVACGAVGFFHRIESVAAEAISPLTPVLLIDAGHGGFDGGAQGADGTVEKNVNLEISQRINRIASLCGFQTVMVRDSDRSVEEEGITGLRNRKVSDLHQRLKLTEQYPQAIFLSIHQNHFPDETQWGTQVFYGPNHPQSRILAQQIQKNVIECLQPENRRAIKEAQDNLFLLTQTTVPAVMVECGFLSNQEECKQLCQPDYQQQLSFLIVRSVLEFHKQDAEGMEQSDGAQDEKTVRLLQLRI